MIYNEFYWALVITKQMFIVYSDYFKVEMEK